MVTTVKPFPHPKGAQLMGVVQSNVSYEFLATQDGRGFSIPLQIGKGKFAKVYKGWQRSAGRNVRPVAIKVLHDHANHSAERLFKQEIELLKELTAVSSVNVVSTLDIVHLGPMVMCGCGNVYHPNCPECGEMPLRRKDPLEKEYPSLYCSKCNYELSGQLVHDRYGELLRPRAKLCCVSGPKEQSGTIINFVEREAVVMELLEGRLDDFADRRRRTIQQLCAQHGRKLVSPKDRPGGRLLRWAREQRDQNTDEVLLHKVSLLEKILVMVQLAEAVAWLHGEKRIVHKDLAPDNIMVRFVGDDTGGVDWRGDRASSFRDKLNDMASYPTFSVKVIDFGLSDKDELSRSWYEEEAGAGHLKHPYLSPEARLRKLPINGQLEIETEAHRFRIPVDLEKRLMESDIVADVYDNGHNYDLEIVKIEKGPPGSGESYAYFKGDPPPNPMNRQLELVRRLGEAHDIYALGALFYYILTEQHDEVEDLRALVVGLQNEPCELIASALMRRDSYANRRNAMREKFWQDDLMVLILRAMVRGQPQSFVKSRIDRGPEPAQRLLRETKSIYHGLQQEILAAPRVSRMQRVAAAAALAGVLGLGLGGGLLLNHLRPVTGHVTVGPSVSSAVP